MTLLITILKGIWHFVVSTVLWLLLCISSLLLVVLMVALLMIMLVFSVPIFALFGIVLICGFFISNSTYASIDIENHYNNIKDI